MNRKALFYKLGKLGIPTTLLKAVKNIYERVGCNVMLPGGYLSSQFESGQGVKQGCGMSSLLFSLMIDDVIEYIGKVETHPPCLQGHNAVLGLLYADDLVLVSSTVIGLQRGFNQLSKYCEDWGMKINVDKTKCMAIKKGLKYGAKEKWFYEGVRINNVKCFKYLGVSLSMNGRWFRQEEDSCAKVKLNLISMTKNMFKYDLKWGAMYKIFNLQIKPIVTYGCEIWGLEIGNALDKIKEEYYRKFLGTSKSTPKCSILREVGEVRLRDEVKIGPVRMWLKVIKGRQDSFTYLAVKEITNDVCGWVNGVRMLLDRIGLGWVFRLGKANKKGVIKIVEERIRDIGWQEILEECRYKKSLVMLNTFGRVSGRERYVSECKRLSRWGWAWVRCGRWSCENAMNGENEVCVLCGMTDSITHIVCECPATLEIRKCLEIDQLSLDGLDLFNSKCIESFSYNAIENIGVYLTKCSELRKKRRNI